MRPAITRAILFVVCAAGSSGCFTSHVLVTVRPDGSGPVEQTATIRPADLPAFDKLASPDLAANAQNPSDIAKQFQKDVGKADQGWLVGGNLRLRATRPINTNWKLASRGNRHRSIDSAHAVRSREFHYTTAQDCSQFSGRAIASSVVPHGRPSGFPCRAVNERPFGYQ